MSNLLSKSRKGDKSNQNAKEQSASDPHERMKIRAIVSNKNLKAVAQKTVHKHQYSSHSIADSHNFKDSMISVEQAAGKA